jgi:membrane-bound lytic murein transglycosylase B
MKYILLLLITSIGFAKVESVDVDNFVKKVSAKNNLNEQSVREILSHAQRQQSIIDAMNRPAEKQKKWFEYRAIFLKDKRINQGVNFWNKHKTTLTKVSNESGVPIEIIVAIIGVETYYGGNKGHYKVLDALYTLAFDYPKRSKFFTKELEQFLVLAEKENISATETQGSYAGAMGFGQFMPSSYLMYAKDYDLDGQRDLIDNIDDAIASVANYLKAHGWKNEQAIIYQASANKGFKPLKKQALKPSLTIKELKEMGYTTDQKLVDDEYITLIQLQQKNHKEYWFGLHNFYVITRYNHSEMYAMAVYQLALAIKSKYKAHGE